MSNATEAPREATYGRRLLVNSACAWVLAASVATTLHEGAHAVAGLALGHPVTLSSFSADSNTAMSDQAAAVMTAAGPVFSLVFGIVVILTGRNLGNGFVRLFVMWLGFISVQNFVGYLVITPFGAGDSGAFVDELHLPRAVAFLFSALGTTGLAALAWLFLRHEVRYITSAGELRQVGLYAWLIGTAVTVAHTAVEAVINGAEPGIVAIVMAGAASAGIFVPIFSRAWRKVSVTRERLELTIPTTAIVLAIVVIAVQIAVLAPGVLLG